ncbi:hypothetical protein AbD4_00109 [Acinetobacter baumannii]|nr:hypothetical protein AbD4_00109 [Acinetobacter baumannii]
MKIISINQSVKIHTSCSSILLMIFLLLIRDRIQRNTKPSSQPCKLRYSRVSRRDECIIGKKNRYASTFINMRARPVLFQPNKILKIIKQLIYMVNLFLRIFDFYIYYLYRLFWYVLMHAIV